MSFLKGLLLISGIVLATSSLTVVALKAVIGQEHPESTLDAHVAAPVPPEPVIPAPVVAVEPVEELPAVELPCPCGKVHKVEPAIVVDPAPEVAGPILTVVDPPKPPIEEERVIPVEQPKERGYFPVYDWRGKWEREKLFFNMKEGSLDVNLCDVRFVGDELHVEIGSKYQNLTVVADFFLNWGFDQLRSEGAERTDRTLNRVVFFDSASRNFVQAWTLDQLLTFERDESHKPVKPKTKGGKREPTPVGKLIKIK